MTRNPGVGSQTEIWFPAPRFRGDKFSEDDLYTSIFQLLKIYVELGLGRLLILFLSLSC